MQKSFYQENRAEMFANTPCERCVHVKAQEVPNEKRGEVNDETRNPTKA